jgi:hypothetical protein
MRFSTGANARAPALLRIPSSSPATAGVERHAAQEPQHRVCDPLTPRDRRHRPAAVAQTELVERLDQHREADGGIDVALRDVGAEAVGNQHEPDHQQESQAQDHQRRVCAHEAGERSARREHRDHRDAHRGHHHVELVHHADRGDDRIEREHRVEHDNLRHDRPEGGMAAAAGVFLRRFGLEPLVDLDRRLDQQERAARDQDEIAPRQL